MKGVGGGRGSEIHIEGDRTWCGLKVAGLLFCGEGLNNICACCFQIMIAKMPLQWSYF